VCIVALGSLVFLVLHDMIFNHYQQSWTPIVEVSD